jgi:hypothetical protein
VCSARTVFCRETRAYTSVMLLQRDEVVSEVVRTAASLSSSFCFSFASFVSYEQKSVD